MFLASKSSGNDFQASSPSPFDFNFAEVSPEKGPP